MPVDFAKFLKNRAGAQPQKEAAMAKTESPKGKASKGKTFDDTNRGVLFINDKDGNDARPDFTGKLSLKVEDFEVDGDGNIEIRLAAWKQDSPKIGEYLSVAASVPKAKD